MKCPVASPGCQGLSEVLTPGYFRAIPTASPYPYRGDGTILTSFAHKAIGK
ncbi:MAG: hypothetical protein MR609_03505 [Bacteroidales bacterium]|nr:hypothetical protein [Bacteroidales bacterium]